mgnify:CR=1 FL=1
MKLFLKNIVFTDILTTFLNVLLMKTRPLARHFGHDSTSFLHLKNVIFTMIERVFTQNSTSFFNHRPFSYFFIFRLKGDFFVIVISLPTAFDHNSPKIARKIVENPD